MVEAPFLDPSLLATIALWCSMIASRFVDSARLTRSRLAISSTCIPTIGSARQPHLYMYDCPTCCMFLHAIALYTPNCNRAMQSLQIMSKTSMREIVRIWPRNGSLHPPAAIASALETEAGGFIDGPTNGARLPTTRERATSRRTSLHSSARYLMYTSICPQYNAIRPS
jgi:hypothetical protein